MVEIGYALSSEEHMPNDLVRYAKMAEDAGFTFALISDHYHPWIDRQGQSPFVWSVIGAIAHATERLRLGTGVTCPTMRIHPAIIAQAAATAAAMMPGRFFLGVGTGENLNEHILGDRWPHHETRLEMLEEAIEIIRLLWEGGTQSYEGAYYEVENARIYTLPKEPPPLYIAGDGKKTAELAGQAGDGRISHKGDPELADIFRRSGGEGKPMIGQVTVCWAADEAEARRTAFEWWPNSALEGELSVELRTPALFEQACKMVTEEKVAEAVVCGPDAKKHIDKIREYADAGFDQIYVHQVGPDQQGFMDFYKREVLPEFARSSRAKA